ncbi:unnamed protein product [Ixodes persulcatus]
MGTFFMCAGCVKGRPQIGRFGAMTHQYSLLQYICIHWLHKKYHYGHTLETRHGRV